MPPKKEESSQQNIVLTEEQFSALLSQIRGQPQREITSPVTTQVCGSFVKCTARFNGDENSDVDAFIDSIQTYKECSNISDDKALRGLSMLFEGLAATWWQGIKATVTNWDSAINTLKDVYSRKLPPHLIYRKVFEQEQKVGETTELFVCNIRALFAQLPYTLSEEAQLDMVYGLLNRKVRKRMPRKDFESFKEMLNLARSIEQAVQETNATHPPNETKPSGEKSKEIKTKCAYCKAYGHSKEDCRKLNKREDKSTNPGTNKTTLVCFGCGTPGYIRAKCPTCSQKKTSEAKVDAISFYSVSAANTDLKRRPLIPITIAGAQGVAFADSGAQVNLASATLYELLRKTNHVFTESNVNLSFADGRSRGKTILETKTDVQIQDRIIETTFIVLPEVQDNNTLLGTQFLKEARIVLNFGENNWFFADEGDKCYEFVNEDVLPKNQQLFEVCEQNLRVDEGIELSPQEKQTLNTLLNAHEDIFRLGGDPTTFAVHEINTGDHRPISTPPYPIHGPRKEFLNNELDRLLAEGIIEECESPWASPVVLVPKKNGQYRLCVDYRNINAITQADTYPMPRIEDLLHSAKSTKYMSTIDLQAGYWQVPIQDSDKDKTCFTTQFGTFRFVRMPFGLRNAPATFMRLMDRFRSGLRDMAIFAYLDDILVLSDTFEKHILDLTSIFDRLRLFNLRARREKCFFVRSSVKYLGHTITPDGIRPDPDKIVAISEMPTPKSVKHVQSFVQTCSWFRKFIAGFSEISRPLTDLLKKKSKFYADKSRGACTFYKSKDLVLLKTHPISSTSKGVTAKLMPRRDGPYEIDKAVSPTTYILSDPYTNRKIGKYHVSDLTPFFGRTEEIPEPTVPKRQRGRPRKLLSSSRGRQAEARGGEV